VIHVPICLDLSYNEQGAWMITYRMYAMTPILQRSTLLSYIFPLTTSGAEKTNILSVPADNVTISEYKTRWSSGANFYAALKPFFKLCSYILKSKFFPLYACIIVQTRNQFLFKILNCLLKQVRARSHDLVQGVLSSCWNTMHTLVFEP